MEIVFLFMRYLGLCHIWDMHNVFIFDCRHGVRAYLQKVKGVSMRQLCLLKQVEILSDVESWSCIFVI